MPVFQIRPVLLLSCLLGMVIGAAPAPGSEEVARPPAYGAWGFDLMGQDRSVRPGDDFFRHGNGAWFDRTAIPPDRSWTGVDVVLVQLVEGRLRAILEGGEPGADELARKLRAVYGSFMDERRVEALGLAPTAAYLAEIRDARSHEELAEVIGRPGTFNIGPFRVDIYPDDKAPDRYAVYLGQSGLGLPDRDYYLLPGFAGKKEAYRAYVAEMLALAGWPSPGEASAGILAFETAIAEASWSAVERRDSERAYNPTSLAELEAVAPFPWRAWLRPGGLEGRPRFIARENTALPRIAALYAATPLDTLRAWQVFHQVDGAAPYLPRAFVEAQFRFRSQELDGVGALPDRWRRAITALNGHMGEALGRLYVERHFPESARRQVEGMVSDLKVALRERLEHIPWMSPTTRAKAVDKLDRLSMKIGYPKAWRDYGALAVRPDALLDNISAAMIFEQQRSVRRLDEPVDRDEWTAPPQTVNAFYDSNQNAMTLPAAELQPPYFDPAADPAVNYGGVGAIIGHEFIHGFDDDGRRFDGGGVLASWWGEAEVRAFKERAAELGRQYGRFEIFPGAFVNGDLTMGENIADLGGLLVAHDAYRRSLGGRPAAVLDGLTGDQRFFLGFAQAWRGKTREDAQRRLLVSDPHAPEASRVNGSVRNVDAWYEAFGVRPGDKLYLPPDKRVRIW